MSELRMLHRDWRRELTELVGGARETLIICAPYITATGSDAIQVGLAPEMRTAGCISVLTDLSPLPICQGATEPAALQALSGAVSRFRLFHLPRLHAKVYIADQHRAIITSGNLSAGGLYQNYEYGVCLTEPADAGLVRREITGYAELGATVGPDQLAAYCAIAGKVRDSYRECQRTIARNARQQFEAVMRQAEDDLIRWRLAGGAMHTVFARTITYLLRTVGPLSTIEIHARIEGIHPDLCDNTVDRIIDGKRFGKRWKHAVRTAQQQLKRRGLVELRGSQWRLAPGDGGVGGQDEPEAL